MDLYGNIPSIYRMIQDQRLRFSQDYAGEANRNSQVTYYYEIHCTESENLED